MSYTKEEARYHSPESPTGLLNKILHIPYEIYSCKRCANLIPVTDTTATEYAPVCKIVEGNISPDGSCMKWSYFGLRPYIK